MDYKMFGPRVFVEEVEETYEGLSVVFSSSLNVNHRIGKIVAVGDGKNPDETETPVDFVSVGDIVMYQVNNIMLQNSSYNFGNKNLLSLHVNELIAKVKSTTITLDTFEILGRWTLLEGHLIPLTSMIVIPSQSASDATQTEWVRFSVDQVGALVDLPIGKGDEVILDRTRLNSVLVGREERFYVPRESVLGLVEGSDLQQRVLESKSKIA